MLPLRRLTLAVALLSALAHAQQPSAPVTHPAFPTGPTTPLGSKIAELLADPAAARAHWGIAVTTLDGTPIYGLDEGKLFRPASNAKLFTTAAAMAMLGPDTRFTTRVIAEGKLTDGKLEGNLILRGGGDPDFALDIPLPYNPSSRSTKNAAQPLADIDALAEQVAAKGLRVVQGDIIGDDSEFEQPAYAEGWSTEDMLWGYGAPVSALTIHDNQIDVAIAPASEGKPASITLEPAVPYYRINPRRTDDPWTPNVLTQSWGKPGTQTFWRTPGSRDLFIMGDIKPGQSAVHQEVAIDDPAEYAAMALRDALLRKGITITGTVRARHRPGGDEDDFLKQTREPLQMPQPLLERIFRPGKVEWNVTKAVDPNKPEPDRTVLVEHLSPTLADDLTYTEKVSQNLHAEIILRDISVEKLGASHSLAHSVQLVRQFWLRAGLDGDDFLFYDGSGLSAKDLVAPRATAKLLSFATTQPWFAQWKASLPIGGVDGSLEHRFTDAPLKGHVFAKTGTLGESRALSGYLDCASGRQVIFSIMVDNHLPGTPADRATMDKIVAAIAATQ